MPVYEYECKNCGKRFDKLQPIAAEPLTKCELCGEGPVRRVLQPVGVVFKGSGWYITDNRGSNSAGKPAESSKSDASKPAAESKSSTDSSGTSESSSPSKTSSSSSSD